MKRLKHNRSFIIPKECIDLLGWDSNSFLDCYVESDKLIVFKVNMFENK